MRACEELGVEPWVVKRKFKDARERLETALVEELLGRHLSPVAWAQVFEKYLAVRGVVRKPGPKGDSPTVGLIAEELGVPRSTAFWRLAALDKLRDHPDLMERVAREEMTVEDAIERTRLEEAAVDQATDEKVPPKPKPELPGLNEFLARRLCDLTAEELRGIPLALLKRVPQRHVALNRKVHELDMGEFLSILRDMVDEGRRRGRRRRRAWVPPEAEVEEG